MQVQFGRYELISRIAVGGMAEVFRAKIHGAENFEKLVAIKRIHPSFTASPEFVNMFIDEAKIAASLSHGNIAHIFDLGRVEDQYFIAMELVEGVDTRRILEGLKARGRAGVPPLPATYIIAEACRGLHYAHGKTDSAGKNLGIIHRDISPSNVLVSFDGAVKIVDFGIAKAEHKLSRTRTGALKGKYCYLSPEAVRGLGIDQRSDIFSAGAVLYELITSRRLFNGRSEIEILERIRDAVYEPPSTYVPDLDPHLEAILLNAIDPDPNRRYQTAQELAIALESYLHAQEKPTSPENLVEMLGELFPNGSEVREEPVQKPRSTPGRRKARRPPVPKLPSGSPSESVTLQARPDDAPASPGHDDEDDEVTIARPMLVEMPPPEDPDFVEEEGDFSFSEEEDPGAPTMIQQRPLGPDEDDVSTEMHRPVAGRPPRRDRSPGKEAAQFGAGEFADAKTAITTTGEDEVIDLDDASISLIELVSDQMSAAYSGPINEAPTYIGQAPTRDNPGLRVSAPALKPVVLPPMSMDLRRGFIGLGITVVLALFLSLLVILTRPSEPAAAPPGDDSGETAPRTERGDDDDDDAVSIMPPIAPPPVSLAAVLGGEGKDREPGGSGRDGTGDDGEDADSESGASDDDDAEDGASDATERPLPKTAAPGPRKPPGRVTKPKPKPKPKKAPVSKVAKGGFLTLSIKPDARVAVDGKGIGNGAKFKAVSIGPGTHRIALDNDKLGLHKVVKLDVSPGEHHYVNVSGDKWHIVTKTAR